MDALEAQRQADEERTKRLFVGFLSSALGVDQTYIGEDAMPGGRPGQYLSVNPVSGNYSVMGQSVSSQNGLRAGASGLSVGTLLLLAAVVYLVVK